MYVRLCGIDSTHNRNFKVEQPRGFGDYLFLYMKTPTRFYFDGNVQDAAPGDIILYRKGDPQYYEELEVIPHVDDYLFFDVENETEQEFMDQLPLKYNQLLKLPHTHPFMNIHQMICHEYVSQNLYRKESMDYLMRSFLIKLCESMTAEHLGYSQDIFERIQSLRLALYSSPARQWTVKEMADYVNLSVSYFQSIYKKFFHTSCMADLFTSRMNYARELLTTTDLPVNEVALKCGYDSNIYFSRHFKKKVGMTPSEYRNRC